MQAVNRLHLTNSAPFFQSRWCHQCPFLHHLWQQIQAEFLPFASTPAFQEISFISRMLCGLRMMPKLIAASLQLGNLHFRPFQRLTGL